MSTGSPHLVLLTRVPVPGRVKTRLMGVLPGEQCAQLQRAFALDAVERLAPLGLPLTVRYSNEAADNPALLWEFLAEVEKAWELGGGNGGLRLEPQRGDDLGARMASAIEDELARGAGGCLLTGSDLPFMGAGLLARALDAFGFEPAGAGLGPTRQAPTPTSYSDQPKTAATGLWGCANRSANSLPASATGREACSTTRLPPAKPMGARWCRALRPAM